MIFLKAPSKVFILIYVKSLAVHIRKVDCFALFSLGLFCRDCSINISEFRGGQRHNKWISLKNIKMGRIHIAITVHEDEVSFYEYKILEASLFC
jgi:hypothetical protein